MDLVSRRVWWLVPACILWLSSPTTALDIADVRWNFENLRVPGTFNFVTVTVRNLDAGTFDGGVTLRPRAAATGPVGVPVHKRLILAPGGTARLQFHVFVTHDTYAWQLGWGRRLDQRLELKLPPIGRPGYVFLASPHYAVPAPEGLRKFPEKDFPRTAAVLSTARELAIGHVPEWTPEQRRALKDWIRGGGVLHVFAEPSGRLPVFDGTLAPLNGEFGTDSWGVGQIVRHRTPAAHASRQQLVWPADNEVKDARYYYPDEETHIGVLKDLASRVRPEHSWGWIYTLSLIYLVLVVPVNALIGKKLRDYRLALLFLVGCVVLFSYVFMKVGARGYGERTSIHTVARAEVLGEGDYDVMRWSQAFVTESGVYFFHYEDEHAYESILRREPVPGVIRDTGEGRGLVCDMPLFSSRDFVSRGTFKKPGVFVASIAEGSLDGATRDLAFEAGLGYPRENQGAWLRHDGAVYELIDRGDGLLRPGAMTTEFEERPDPSTYYYHGDRRRETHPERIVIGQRIGSWDVHEPLPEVPPDAAQIIVLAELPPEFRHGGEIQEQGQVVYHQLIKD